MEIRSGSLIFTSKFDSGNLLRVERIVREDEMDGKISSNSQDVRPDYEYQVWTKPDCHATEFENGNRSWFYFGIRGYIPNKTIKITIMNMNRQNRLYSQGHAPFYKVCHPNRPQSTNWCRVRERPVCETVEGQFLLTFTHRFGEPRGGTVFFAFCYPWSYAESQEQMDVLDQELEHCKRMSATSPNCPEDIYYHRELLCYSLDKLRVDLLTITDCYGMDSEREERFDLRLFPDEAHPRPWKFKRKKVYLVSSRVHPGETPASFVYNGFLKFILRRDDPRAIQLRRNFVFKLIPMLNPDGVMRGHYRTDSRGLNLNRVYLDPDFDLHPPIYAAKAVLVYHHVANSFKRQEPVISRAAAPVSKPCPPHLRHCARHVEEKPRAGREDLSIEEEAVPGESKHRIINIVHADTPPPLVTSVSSQLHDCMSPELPAPPLQSRSRTASLTGDFGELSASEPAVCAREEAESASASRAQHTIIDQTRLSQELLWSPVAGTAPSSPLLAHPAAPPPMSPPTVPAAATPPVPQLVTPTRKAAIVSVKFNKESEAPVRSQPKTERRRFWSWRKNKQGDHGDAKPSSPVLGNEGSDGESDDGVPAFNPSAPNSPHLCSPQLLEISPDESGVAFYIDLHGHCSKRGCFMYGNSLDAEEQMVENMLFPKLIGLNTAHFDFSACNFTVKNMYQRDKRDGLSKEGAGRVAVWKHLGVVHSYTLESNYNTGRTVNHIAPVAGCVDNGRATPPPLAGFPPKYTTQHYEEVGRAMAVAALDIFNLNPWSRINTPEFGGVGGIREWVRKYLRGLRGGPRTSVMAYATRAGRGANAGGSSTSSSQSAASRTSCWPVSVTGTNRSNAQPTTSAAYSRPARPSLQGATASSNGPTASGSTGQPAYRRPYPSHLRHAAASGTNTNGGGGSGSGSGGGSGLSNGGASKAPTTMRSLPGKSERVGAIQRQSLAMQRDPRPSYAYKLDPACEPAAAPVAPAALQSPIRASLPGEPSEADLPEAPPEESAQLQQQQQAARVLMQMEMISCGAAMAPLRPRPLVRSRLSASSSRAAPPNAFAATVGDARLVVLPYDASTAAGAYSMSSPVLPLVTTSDAARHAAAYRPSAAASDPAIQSFGFDQKLLEDRKVEKLRSLKDSKRRRHELSFPPHRLGTLKVGGGSGSNGGGNGGGSSNNGERRKSRRSMSFAGKSHSEPQWLITSRGHSKPAGGSAEGAPADRMPPKHTAKGRHTKAPRRRKTVGLHGKQAAFSEGDVGKDGAEDDDSSSTGELYANEHELQRRLESPITAFQSTLEEAAAADDGKADSPQQQEEELLFGDCNDSLRSQATPLGEDE